MDDLAPTTADTRYEQLFEIEHESESLGVPHIDDPFSIWDRLLAEGPVHKGSLGEVMGLGHHYAGPVYLPGFDYYSAISYQAVSDAYVRKDDFDSSFLIDMKVDQVLGDSIFNMDGLRHRRYRDVVQAYFQPPAASGWWREKVVEPLVDELVSAFEKEASVDLNSQLFARLPMHTVTAGFGLSPEEGLAFRQHVQLLFSHGASEAEKAAAIGEVIAILEPIVRRRQADPQDDIISRLAHELLEEEDGSRRRLTVEEITAFCRLIVFGGGGTTWRQLGITTFALLNDREQLDLVMRDRNLIDRAILESVRWQTTDPLFYRKATRDTNLCGVDIPKGAIVHLCLGSANRDPTRWDNPDRFDVRRKLQRSTAFGAGHHSCLGQHLARQEMISAFNALFDRFPNLRWDPHAPPAKIMGGLIGRGPGPLHVLLK